MKKLTFNLIATAALIFTPVAALAQDSQQNLQINHSAAAGVGEGNLINQGTDQYSNQIQLNVNTYGYYEPSNQVSVQDNAHTASAVGDYNLINQDIAQQNIQSNGNVETYPTYYPVQY